MKDQHEAKQNILSDKSIGEIVAGDFRSAKVFEKYGIDFCCGGKASLAASCTEKGIDLALIVEELESIKDEPVERSQNYTSWALPFLADYIVNTHHVYLKENMQQIAAYANKIAGIHGAHHPELYEIASLFSKIVQDMIPHLKEEEEVLFPTIKRVKAARIEGLTVETKDLELIRLSLDKLQKEHEAVGDAVHAIRHLAKGYEIPDDVCNTFRMTYQKLEEFEDDLHKHVHLENNILFPKAAQL